jgi:hypothetical protein
LVCCMEWGDREEEKSRIKELKKKRRKEEK